MLKLKTMCYKFQKSIEKNFKITMFLYMFQIDSQNYLRMFFIFFIFLKIQIWLNRLMDDHQCKGG